MSVLGCTAQSLGESGLGNPEPYCPRAGPQGEEEGSAHRRNRYLCWGLLSGHNREQFLDPGWLGGRVRAIRVFFRGGSAMEGKNIFHFHPQRARDPRQTAVLPQRCPSYLPFIPPCSLEQAAILPRPHHANRRLRSVWHLCLLALFPLARGL